MPSIDPTNPLGYRDPFNLVPQGFARSASGQLVPVQSGHQGNLDPSLRKKGLVVLQYWSGDLERVDILANLIADLERVFNPDVDILLFGRKDCRPYGLQVGTIDRLRAKFATVHVMDDAGNYANGFPWAANDMWQDLVSRLGQPQWVEKYRWFLNLEWDCVPTRPSWLTELAREFDMASLDGFSAIGAKQSDPSAHLNGVAVYSTEINKRAGGVDGGCAPHAAYDIWYAPKILPLAMNTPKIALDYRRPTITPDELFASPAALYHGVRDMSAVTAVRDEHVNHLPRGNQTFSQRTVFTFRRRIPGWDEAEIEAQLDLWARGWQSAGWNPVVLGRTSAERHPLYVEYMARVNSFPTINIREYENACWERWLALSNQGGGLMVDFDVLPRSDFNADKLPPKQAGVFQVLGNNVPCAVQADKAGLEAFIAAVLAYEPGPSDKEQGKPHVSDMHFVQKVQARPEAERGWIAALDFVRERDAKDFRQAALVHFSARAVRMGLPGFTKSRAMGDYLRGY
jgi:hypothetical protein